MSYDQEIRNEVDALLDILTKAGIPKEDTSTTLTYYAADMRLQITKIRNAMMQIQYDIGGSNPKVKQELVIVMQFLDEAANIDPWLKEVGYEKESK